MTELEAVLSYVQQSFSLAAVVCLPGGIGSPEAERIYAEMARLASFMSPGTKEKAQDICWAIRDLHVTKEGVQPARVMATAKLLLDELTGIDMGSVLPPRRLSCTRIVCDQLAQEAEPYPLDDLETYFEGLEHVK